MRLYITSDISMLLLLFSSIRPLMWRTMTKFWGPYYLIVFFVCKQHRHVCTDAEEDIPDIYRIETELIDSVREKSNWFERGKPVYSTFFLFADLHWMSNTAEPASQPRTCSNESVGQRRTSNQFTIRISSYSLSSLQYFLLHFVDNNEHLILSEGKIKQIVDGQVVILIGRKR